MKTKRESWIESFTDDTELWIVELNEEKNVGLYMSKVRVPATARSPSTYRNPIYHVWEGDDKWLCATENYLEAYGKYKSLI